MSQRYFLELSYDGSNYHGWQIQPNAPTIQEKINESLSKIAGREVNVVGCGRTDTGVHAEKFFAHVDLEQPLEVNSDHLVRKLNGMLPSDIGIHGFFPVEPDTHARFSATSRSYEYRILRRKDPFLQNYSYPYYYGNLDVKKMNGACRILQSYSDFTSFSKLHTDVKTNLCSVASAEWHVDEPLLIFRISADRFLRNMVRAIVGTLIDIGRNNINEHDFRRIIESKNRSEAGFSVPAKGLFLVNVEYPAGLIDRFSINN